MKRLIQKKIILGLILLSLKSYGQVPLTSIVEHFTNTSCSVCAANNHNIYNTINNHPNTLHIAFHPSSPYSNDFFNLQNQLENDDRAMFYDVFGGTPQTVLNGIPMPYNNLNVGLNNANSLTTNYELNLSQTQVTADSFMVKVVITKIADDDNLTARLFLGVIEDTVYQTTNNGEQTHYNVFRKALNTALGGVINLPAAVGDSIINSFHYKSGASWNVGRLHTIGILQKLNKELINSAKSHNTAENAVGINSMITSFQQVLFYPNPFVSEISFDDKSLNKISIYNLKGECVYCSDKVDGTQKIFLGNLPSGLYLIKAIGKFGEISQKMLKK